jgi:hypothetical protein
MASLPDKFLINSVELVDNTSYVSSDTRNLIYRQRKTVGQRYEFRIRSVELDQSDIKSVMAGISAIERSNDVLTLSLPIFSQSAAGQRTAAQARAIGEFQCNISSTASVAVGDFFKFAGHSKAYQVTAVSGAQITFTPNLQRPVANGEQITFNGVQFTCKIKGRPQRFTVNADRNSAVVELDLVEAK